MALLYSGAPLAVGAQVTLLVEAKELRVATTMKDRSLAAKVKMPGVGLSTLGAFCKYLHM